MNFEQVSLSWRVNNSFQNAKSRILKTFIWQKKKIKPNMAKNNKAQSVIAKTQYFFYGTYSIV